MKPISGRALDRLLYNTGTITKEMPKEEKQKWRDSYRAVESFTIQMIKKYGSIEAWYESGKGRLF